MRDGVGSFRVAGFGGFVSRCGRVVVGGIVHCFGDGSVNFWF